MSAFGDKQDASVFPGVQPIDLPTGDFDVNMTPRQQQQPPITFPESDLALFQDADLLNFEWDETASARAFNNHEVPTGLSLDFQSPHMYQPGDMNFAFSPETPSFQQDGQFIQPFPRDMSSTVPQTKTSPNSQSSSRPSQPGSPDSKKHDSAEPSIKAENLSPEEVARRAADEDKRRRNTAASARFRVKKKQREQAMEKTAKDMGDRVRLLETKISTLEAENKFLRDLITEKEGRSVDFDELRLKQAKKKSNVKTES